MLLFGLALVTGGVSVLVTFRDELRNRPRSRRPRATIPRTWVVRTWMRTRPPRRAPRAVGRAYPPPSCRLPDDGDGDGH